MKHSSLSELRAGYTLYKKIQTLHRGCMHTCFQLSLQCSSNLLICLCIEPQINKMVILLELKLYVKTVSKYEIEMTTNLRFHIVSRARKQSRRKHLSQKFSTWTYRIYIPVYLCTRGKAIIFLSVVVADGGMKITTCGDTGI